MFLSNKAIIRPPSKTLKQSKIKCKLCFLCGIIWEYKKKNLHCFIYYSNVFGLIS